MAERPARSSALASGEGEEEGELEVEPPFASVLPPELSATWPSPRRAVLGARGGAFAWIEYVAARAVLGGVARIPRAVQTPILAVFARLAKAVDRRRSAAARVFLRQALGAELRGKELERRVLDSWKHLFRVTLDAEILHLRVDFRRIEEHLVLELAPDVRRILESKRGAILATPHLGDWETGSAAMAWIGFDPFYAVAKPPKNRFLSIHLHRVRERRGVRVLPRRGAMKDAPAIVKGGGMIALVLDQRARKRPLLAPFFGRTARCDRSAAVLVKRLRAPIVIGACFVTEAPWRWRVHLPVVLWPEDLEGMSVEEVTGRINREFEKLILMEPAQYFWLHDRYRGV
jgi:KDO2-lipid IV(A) lauroyltransferase